MTTQHTPGPWIVYLNREDITIEWRPSADLSSTVKVARVAGTPQHPESVANANLIAASPELLDLAYQYLSDLRYPPTGDSVQRRLERAAQVIAKATGQ